jgi:hypothetical protein
MKPTGSHRGGLLTAGAILSIVGGAFAVVGGGIMVGLVIAHRELFSQVGHGALGGNAGIRFGPFGVVDLTWFIIVGVPFLVLGVIAITGGLSAIRRKSFGVSLTGAICALPPVIFAWYFGVGGLSEVVFLQTICGAALIILGVLAVIFVALGKREFGAQA